MANNDLAAKHFFKGLQALDKGDLAAAEDDLRAALRLAPGRPSVLVNLAVVSTRRGRLDEALEHAGAAVAADPGQALAWLQQGAVQHKLQRHEDALHSLDKSIALDQTVPEAHNNRGAVLKELGRLEEALSSCDRAISLKQDYAEAYSNRGVVLKFLGRPADALASLDRAISLKPVHADAHANRGGLLRDQKKLQEALASFDTAIGLKPEFAEVISSRAHVLRSLGRYDEARAGFAKAIGITPGLADAWLGLADIEADSGDFAKAEENYRKAHALQPMDVAPLCRMTAIRKIDAADPLIGEIEAMLGDDTLPPEDRAELHHAYAKVCNDLGRYDEAVAQFSAGKALLPQKFDMDRLRAGFATLKNLFTPQFFADRAAFGLADERPVFIVGMPRSGTSLTEQILASHALVDGLGELPDLPRIASGLGRGLRAPADFAAAVSGLRAEDVGRLAARYQQAYARTRPGSTRIIDKMPHNFQWLGLVALMFPKAHIIHCSRNPLDTCVSVYMQNFIDKHDYAKDFTTLGHYYREYEGLMQHWHDVLPVPVRTCRYEELVRDLDANTRELVSVLGLAWDPACLDYRQKEHKVRTASRWQVRQPVYDTSVERWRRYEPHLGPLKQALGIS